MLTRVENNDVIVHGSDGQIKHRYVPKQSGIWKMMKTVSYNKYEKTFKAFCELIYKDHTNPPTREQFLNFFIERREANYCGNSLWAQYSHIKKVSLKINVPKVIRNTGNFSRNFFTIVS